MRRRIYNLANGKFEYEKPVLSLSTERLELQVLEGKSYQGSFTIQSENQVPMRGIIYTSNPRMEVLNPQFEGLQAQIRFTFHSEGLMEGNIQKGEFYIICNQNEYNLSFVVNISRLYAESSIGKIRSLHDFSRLAEKNRREAYEIFTSPMFGNLLKKEEGKEATRKQMLYAGLTRPPVTMQSMEEFLIAGKLKSRVELQMMEREAKLEDVTETVKEGFQISRNGWGYLEIRVTSQGDFLRPLREKLGTDDFVGSTVNIEYYVDQEKLHSGKNLGQIEVCTPYQRLVYEVCVHQHSAKKREESDVELRRMQAVFMQNYLDFRLKKMTTGNWAADAVMILDHFTAVEPEEHWYALMKAQVYLINGQRQEAEWILEEKKKTIVDRGSAAWAYYLYLTTLVIREDRYADRILKQVEEICKRHEKDERFSWLLLNLRRDYLENSFGKFHAIQELIMSGCRSSYFYVEAYLLLVREPYILTELGDFEIPLLLWAVRKEALTVELAEQIMVLAGEYRNFEKRIYKILCGCYEICPNEDMLAVICAYLIKGQQYDTVYHHWYEEGIAQDLRLAGLYEAFVYSMDQREVRQVPKMVQMYFRYHSSLPYAKKAALYVNIIANRESMPSVYASYERTMETFALEQMLEGHMDDNLAVIYDTFLRDSLIQQEGAKVLSELLFYRKLTCFDPNMVRLYIVHRQLKEGRSVPLVDGTAYFPIFSSDYLIFLEDRHGNRYASSMEYQLEKLMKPGRFLKRCLELAPDCLSYFIYLLDTHASLEEFGEEEAVWMRGFLRSDQLSEAYRSDLCPKVIRLFQKYQIPIGNPDALLGVNPSFLNQSARNYMMELFIQQENYGLAYQWMQMYGFEEIEPALLVKLAGELTEKEEYGEDEYLVYLCAAVFEMGKYDERILTHLAANYDGPTKKLGKLWRAAKDFGVDTYELEERTLVQMLYSTEYMADTEEMFEHYLRNGGRDVIREAYINYFSYTYFVQDVVLPEDFMNYLLAREEVGRNETEICHLAVLKYLAYHQEKQQQYPDILEQNLMELTAQEKYFAFYKKFPVKIQQKFGFEDRVFVEYHNLSRETVWIFYRVEEAQEYEKMEMKESYRGIYVSEFLLFFGESVQYYISLEQEGEDVIAESNRIAGNEVYEETDRSRYALLNHMLAGITLEDEEKTRSCMVEYGKKDEIYKELFRIL